MTYIFDWWLRAVVVHPSGEKQCPDVNLKGSAHSADPFSHRKRCSGTLCESIISGQAHIGQERVPGELESRRISENYKHVHKYIYIYVYIYIYIYGCKTSPPPVRM